MDAVMLSPDEGASAVAGPLAWAPGLEVSPLMVWLQEAGAPLGGRRLRDGDGTREPCGGPIGLAAGLLEEAGGLHPGLKAGWELVRLARRLVGLGVRLEFRESFARPRASPVVPDELLARLEELGREAVPFYQLDPDGLPFVTREYGERLAAARNGAPEADPRALLGRALGRSSVDEDALARLADVVFYKAFARRAAAEGGLAGPELLPRAYRESRLLVRAGDPAGAASVLEGLEESSPVVMGTERVRLLVRAGRLEEAETLARALLAPPGRAAWSELHLLEGEVALATGDLDRAEAAFEAAYRAPGRAIETGWAVCELYRRHGPAPAARPHLERIAGDAAGRPARDIARYVGPARERLEALETRGDD